MASENLQFDIIVIGAGINGAGIARDAAMRGLKVLLLDKGDIGGGTSSWSTRLIHGGLRYLEHGEFRLVRESLRERSCLLNISPHLVRPLRLLVPVYRKARRGWWTIRAGLIAYDTLSADKKLASHHMLSRKETLQRAPGLNQEGLRGAALYFDAQVEFAERLVLENVLSALEHGATVHTYARVEKLIVEKGTLRGVEFTLAQTPGSRVQSHVVGAEGVSGADHGITARGETLSARAYVVINAAGPWVDQVLTESHTSYSRLIGGTRGSHIIVAPFASAPDTAIYVEAETDGRPFFIIPWNRKYLIGTTDIRFAGNPDDVQITNEEVDYLLRETNRALPAAKLTRERILYTYSGVRPLPFTEDKDEQRITRQHFIREHPRLSNLLSIVGGKLTTYRSLAEQTVDLVLRRLPLQEDPRDPHRSVNCMTADDPLPGASTSDFNTFCADFKQKSGLPEATNDRLLRIYGTRASLLIDLISEDASLARSFDDETGALAAEIVFAFRHELATTLADCFLRRTMIGLNSSCGLTAIEGAAAIAMRYFGWSKERLELETASYKEEIARKFFLNSNL